MNTRQAAGHKTLTLSASALAAAAAYPITTRDAVFTRVRPEVRAGVVTRTIGEIQIYPDAARIDIVLGVGVMDYERQAAAHNAVILPRTLRRGHDVGLWNETAHRRTGERMWRCALFLAAPDPLLHLELEELSLVGGLVSLGGDSGALRAGRLVQAYRASSTSSGIAFHALPSVEKFTLGPSKQTVTATANQLTGCLVSVLLVGANYTYEYLLWVAQSPFNPSGPVTVLANPMSQNDSGWGAPTFAVESYRLTITNSNYPANSVTATVAKTPFGSDSLL